jgi:glycosyltransferase involved in cell wall biosynthesis
MKKLCFFSGDITRSGGTEKVACQIMTGLWHKYEIEVLSLTHSNSQMFYSLPSQIKRMALFDRNPNGIKQYLAIVKKLRSYLKTNQVDVLIDIDTILDMFSVSAVKGFKTKLIGWEHFNFHETMGNRLRVPIRKHMTRYADCVVTLTKEDQKAYSDYFGDKLRVEQIYNPVEFSEKQTDYDVESKALISVGRLARQKGFDYLLDVAELVFAKHPDWEWLILGEGEERPALEETILAKQLSQVKLLGQVSHVDEYLKRSAMFVLTSRFEGFPLVLIEAKAQQLPVVSFRCQTGPSELVEDHINGYLIDCFEIQQMADRICELIENQEKRVAFSEKSRLGLERLDYSGIILQWERLLESI